MIGKLLGSVITDVLIGKGIGKLGEVLKATKTGAALIEKAEKLKLATTAKVAEAFSDKSVVLAKQNFSRRLKELGFSPNNITNIAADPVLWKNALQIAGNKLKNGAVKFAEFQKQMVNEFGKQIEPYVEKLYRESLISLDLSKGKQIISSSGKLIDEAVVREAKEKVFDLVKNNKPVELENYLAEAKNKYGSNFLNELKRTRAEYVDNLYDATRRTVDTHDLLGAHIREQHIGRSETWLRNRLETDPTLKYENYASSFKNEEIANRALGKFVNDNKSEIESWLRKSTQIPLKKTFGFGETVGIGVERGKSGVKATDNVFVMLVKDDSERGWHFQTAFPDIR